MSGFFVTGTDTEVGKTRISTALVELLKQQYQRVAVMKPIASGCQKTAQGLRNDDAMQLQQHASVELPYDIINPYAFQPAIAPHIAAEQIGIEIELATIVSNYQQIKQQSDAGIVEGAGGWLVPINSTQTIADLAKALQLPVILVVAIRLGCINHALLTVKEIAATGLKLHGWIANQIEPNQQAEEIIKSLQQRIDAPCLGHVPQLEAGISASEYIHFS